MSNFYGAGFQPYKNYLVNCTEYISLEYDTPETRARKSADIFYDGVHIPVPDNSFDGILATECLELVPNPDETLLEWHRVLRNGGNVLVTIPFMWPEHDLPYDSQRYTTSGLKRLFEKAEFEVIAQDHLAVGQKAIFQLFIAWFYDAVVAHIPGKALKELFVLFPILPITLLAELLSLIPCRESKTYLDNMILARKK